MFLLAHKGLIYYLCNSNYYKVQQGRFRKLNESILAISISILVFHIKATIITFLKSKLLQFYNLHFLVLENWKIFL